MINIYDDKSWCLWWHETERYPVREVTWFISPFLLFFLPFPVVVLLQQMYVVCCAGHFENHYVCNPVECGLCWLSMFSICEDMKLDQRVVSAERKTITCIIQFSTKRAAWRNATPETLESATWSDLHRDHKNKQTGVITLGCRLITHHRLSILMCAQFWPALLENPVPVSIAVGMITQFGGSTAINQRRH